MWRVLAYRRKRKNAQSTDGGAFVRFLFCWATIAEGYVCAQAVFVFSP